VPLKLDEAVAPAAQIVPLKLDEAVAPAAREISNNELHDVCVLLTKRIGTKDKLENVFKKLDKNESGRLCFKEFCSFIRKVNKPTAKDVVLCKAMWTACMLTQVEEHDELSCDSIWNFISTTHEHERQKVEVEGSDL